MKGLVSLAGGAVGIARGRLSDGSRDVHGVGAAAVVRVLPAAPGKEVRHHQQGQVHAPEDRRRHAPQRSAEILGRARVDGTGQVDELRLWGNRGETGQGCCRNGNLLIDLFIEGF